MRLKGSGLSQIKLITHADLDGTASAVLAKAVFGESADISLEVTSSAESAVESFLLKPKFQYTTLIISDLSLPFELVKRVSDECKKENILFKLFDHHHSSMELNSLSDCLVREDDNSCGASLFYEYLITSIANPEIQLKLKDMRRFIEEVTAYDTGQATEKALELNRLLWILGKVRFIDRFSSDPSIRFSQAEKALLVLDKERIDRYVFSHKLKNFSGTLTLPDGSFFKVAIGFAGDCFQEMFEELFKQYPDTYVAIIINYPEGMSWRFRPGYSSIVPDNNKKSKTLIFSDSLNESELASEVPSTNLADVAKLFGGGGHKESAGNKFSDSFISNNLISFFSNYGANLVLNK